TPKLASCQLTSTSTQAVATKRPGYRRTAPKPHERLRDGRAIDRAAGTSSCHWTVSADQQAMLRDFGCPAPLGAGVPLVDKHALSIRALGRSRRLPQVVAVGQAHQRAGVVRQIRSGAPEARGGGRRSSPKVRQHRRPEKEAPDPRESGGRAIIGGW